MADVVAFTTISPDHLADVLGREQVMDIGIRPVWNGTPRIAGPALTVRCSPGDNLMLHAAIHRAPAGSILVVQAGDVDHAVAAQKKQALYAEESLDSWERAHRARIDAILFEQGFAD